MTFSWLCFFLLILSPPILKCFYVRMEGTLSEKKAEVEAVFGTIQAVESEKVSGEFAFLTEKMTEKEYEERASKLEGIKNRIRVGR